MDIQLMEWMLEQAKANPMKIRHDFDTRYRVWCEQMLPNRLNEIRMRNGDEAYVNRMIKLTTRDCQMLSNRVYKEYEENHNRSILSKRLDSIQNTLTETIKEYKEEIKNE